MTLNDQALAALLTDAAEAEDKAAAHDGKCCLECGAPIIAKQAARATFCGKACRQVWNNRRMKRGADLYDLFMAHRYDRQAAQEAKVWRAMNRLCAEYRDEDNRQRDGRRSWGNPRDVLDRLPWLNAAIGVIRGGR